MALATGAYVHAQDIDCPVEASQASSFRSDPFLLTLSCSLPYAHVHYTVDGHEPGPNRGTLYVGPITIEVTSVIRARAFYANQWSTSIQTLTYLFVADVATQSTMLGNQAGRGNTQKDVEDALLALPSVSIATPIAISQIEGRISAEMIWPDGRPGFQLDCGAEYFGGHSLGYPKKSMRLSFKAMYGPTRLHYDLFGKHAADSFDQLLLRSGSHDGVFYDNGTKGIFIRNRWICDRQLDMGHPAPHGIFVHVYINAVYWGQYHLMERPNAAFMASYLGGDKEDYDALNKGTPIDGDLEAWNEMKTSLGNYTDLQQHMDMTNFADYLILQFYGGNNWDWRASQNWMAAGAKQNPHAFKFFAWDSDMILRRGLYASVLDKPGPHNLWRDLKSQANPAFLRLLADRAQQHLQNDGVLTPVRVTAQFEQLRDRMAASIGAETLRWGQNTGYSVNTWYEQLERVRTEIIEDRSEVVVDQMRSAGLFPLVDAPTFMVNGQPQSSGPVYAEDRLVLDSPVGTVYYTLDGADPQVLAQGDSGTTLVKQDHAKTVLIPTGPVVASWKENLDFDDSAWIAGTGGIGYDTGSAYDPWINMDVQSQMRGQTNSCYARIPFVLAKKHKIRLFLDLLVDDGVVAYLNGVEVARSGFTGTPTWGAHADSALETSGFTTIDITFAADLLREGNNLLALHGLNASTSSSDFLLNATLWIQSMARGGDDIVTPTARAYTEPITLPYSTQVKARVLEEGQWSALSEGFFTVGDAVESLRITEIMYHPRSQTGWDDPNAEYVELLNIGSDPVNLNHMAFVDGIQFTFPNITVLPGDYIVLAKDPDVFSEHHVCDCPVLGPYNGVLKNSGETLELRTGDNRTIHAFEYDDTWYSSTDGLGYSLVVLDPTGGDPSQWGHKTQWSPSFVLDGTPGRPY
ncbi:MAG: CotH kinase family protein [Phycisphaeraceae bacterium]|nr:CotH kinase family protein [Phycisphaeraceae bacterium]